MAQHLLTLLDYPAGELAELVARSRAMKARMRRGVRDHYFAGKTLAMYFEKPSLRTRVSLETAAISLGGGSINLEASAPGQLWKRETVADQARVVSRMVDLVAMRTYSHEDVAEFARHSRVPVVNTLTDWAHPTQALADVQTLIEEWDGELSGKTLAYFGDGNNVARSLLEVCGQFGLGFVHAGPQQYRLPEQDYARVRAACPGLRAEFITDPARAASGADALYTDVWASMGQKDEADARRPVFAPYQINRELLSRARPGAVVLHCLPAVRGEEITDEIMDDESVSRVFEQAENRLHIYRAIFPWLLEKS